MCGGGAQPVTETIKTPMGETGTATPQPKKRAQSLLSRAVVDSSGGHVIGQKQTLGA